MSDPLPRPAQQPRPGWARWGVLSTGLVAVAVLAVAGLAWAEWAGWPMLAAPLAQSLSNRLGRQVSLAAWPPSAPLPRVAAATPSPAEPAVEHFSLRFLGGLRLALPQLTVAAPPWAGAPPTLQARDLRLHLRYIDLWRAWRQQPLHVHSLQAGAVVIDLVRMADGQASWVLSPTTTTSDDGAWALPTFGQLRLLDGRVQWRDAMLRLDAQARWVLVLQPPASTTAAASSAASAVPAAGSSDPGGAGGQAFTLDGSVEGQYQGRPVTASLRASLGQGGAAADGDRPRAAPLQLALKAELGRARLSFDGAVADAVTAVGRPGWLGPTGLQGLAGKFTLQGPSLAAVGDPVGVTLPTTRPFRSAGRLRKDGSTWFVVFDDARIGKSQLHGAFNYDTARPVPMLAGRLAGTRLLLADLGPAVGVPTETAAARPGKLLPDRPFDLAALRVMDANVLINIDELNLDSPKLEPLRPLRAHLQLKGGVLDISAIDARTGPGRLHGSVQLDGRQATAALRTDLRWEGLRLEQWIHQNRGSGKPPWASGTVKGLARLHGHGNSTAAILAHLNGRLQADWQNGRLSHLAVEAAGLDLAQALLVLIKGDEALTVNCAVADLVAEKGVFKPRLMVIDSTDSTLWLDGSISLATEALDLRVIVSPKDFSPLALRAPLRVRGSLADPQVSVETGRLAGRVGLAALLALINPLAGLLPLLDPGDAPAAARDAAGCRRLDQRVNRRVAKPTAHR